jgi:hypothetical protein
MVDVETEANLNYKNSMITTGLTFRLNKNAVVKADIQFSKTELSDDYSKVFNAGIGVMF